MGHFGLKWAAHDFETSWWRILRAKYFQHFDTKVAYQLPQHAGFKYIYIKIYKKHTVCDTHGWQKTCFFNHHHPDARKMFINVFFAKFLFIQERLLTELSKTQNRRKFLLLFQSFLMFSSPETSFSALGWAEIPILDPTIYTAMLSMRH